MNKTNKLVVSLALMASLFGCEKAQETNTQEPKQDTPTIVAVEENVSTNQVVATGATNDVAEVTVKTNTVAKVEAPKKVFRGAVSITNGTEEAKKTIEPEVSPIATNAVETITNATNVTTKVADAIEASNVIDSTTPTNVVDTVAAAPTNIIDTVAAKTNTVEGVKNVIDSTTTNVVDTVAAAPTNIVDTVTAKTNTVEEVKNVIDSITTTNVVDTVATAPTNVVDTVAAKTNTVEATTEPKNVFRGIVSFTNTTDTVKVDTNVVDTVSKETNTVDTVTNMVNTVSIGTNTVAGATNVVDTVSSGTNTVETTTNTVQQAAAPVMTEAQQALLQEVVPQIKPYIMKDGMTDQQLFTLGAYMHLEKDTGTRDLAIMYWKAAEAGMDLRPFEMAYKNRLKEQQDFMRVCQEGVADARINNKNSFVMSGVSFNINSANLVENLMKFKNAKDGGAYSVIIEGQPFKIYRTMQDVEK